MAKHWCLIKGLLFCHLKCLFSGCLMPFLGSLTSLFLSVGYCAFIDAEHALDPSLAEIIGVKTENLLLSQPDTGEQALSLVDTLIRSGSVDVVVVDSVSPYYLIINSIQIMESIIWNFVIVSYTYH